MKFLKIFDRERRLALICLCFFILNNIAYHPGFLSADGVDQYGQALNNKYDDWHPPVMAAWWHVLNIIHRGPSIMLLFQLSLLWTTCFVLMWAINNRVWRISILLMCLMPFIQNFAGYIIKDVQMAYAYLLSVAIMFTAINKKRKLSIAESICCVVLLVYASWIRPNALPATIPICWLLILLWYPQKPRLFKIGFTLCFLSLVAVGQWVFTYKIMYAEKTYPQAKLYMQDITGVYAKTNKSYYPAFLFDAPALDTAILRRGYNPATFDDLWFSTNKKLLLTDLNDDKIAALQHSWKQAIINDPGIYLSNRFDGFLYYLRIKQRDASYTYIFDIMDVNPYGLEYHENILSKIFLKPIKWQKYMPYMQVWFWFFLSFVLLACIQFVKKSEYKRLYAVLTWSSVLYLLPTFFVYQIDTDFRYTYWNCVACSVAICILIADRIKTKPSSE